MLCLDQADRWTAKQLLQHPWILTKDDDLAAKDISGVIKELKHFNSKRRFKAVAMSIIVGIRIKNMIRSRKNQVQAIMDEEAEAAAAAAGKLATTVIAATAAAAAAAAASAQIDGTATSDLPPTEVDSPHSSGSSSNNSSNKAADKYKVISTDLTTSHQGQQEDIATVAGSEDSSLGDLGKQQIVK